MILIWCNILHFSFTILSYTIFLINCHVNWRLDLWCCGCRDQRFSYRLGWKTACEKPGFCWIENLLIHIFLSTKRLEVFLSPRLVTIWIGDPKEHEICGVSWRCGVTRHNWNGDLAEVCPLQIFLSNQELEISLLKYVPQKIINSRNKKCGMTP